ncbi:Vegetative incompatibility protein HET-E-1 [Trametes pubescens]|uniref:Vegetative incompatibility protein HET-E-1 n=1 Tax=Trametes pubescens TaxID=154538 RepID=A0A1M2VRM0_TRAPU|nr:Vegetative incompatibility protein HET-E-1 [Trametes pubescens]
MWLLSTDSFKLVYFDRVDQIEGGYAILSHVWDDSEQPFQDIQRLHSADVSYGSMGKGEHSDCANNRLDGASQDLKNTTPPISNKILGCVKTAKAHGFGWVWIDASCIDKTSSAELSEAINSMFSWYENASVCYAYLNDVSKSCVLRSPKSAFRTSRWFTRGWTLQELIAPRCLVFMSSEWTYIGTKASLAPLLSEITGIDVEVLTFRRELRQVSVARRMSWASGRKTTRVEDEAYSLMGLFGITMPTIYGEDKKAFRRLQEEIMKQSPDQSLFAWGRALPPGARRGRLARDIANPIGTLLAPSPCCFASSAGYRPIPPGRIADAVQGIICVPPSDTPTNPNFAVTSAGIKCQLLVVDFKPFALALLACQTATGECIGLLLHQRHDVQSDRPHYLVGAAYNENGGLPENEAGLRTTAREAEGYRLLYIKRHTLASLLERSIAVHGSSDMVVGERRKVYISRDLSFFPPHPWLRLLEPEPQEIYLPAWFADQCQSVGFELKDNLPPSGDTIRLPRDIRFENELTGEAFVVHLRRIHTWLCVSLSIYPYSHLAYSTHYQPHTSLGPEQLPWRPRAFEEDSLSDGSHPSSLKHCVRYWPNGWKTTGDADRTVRVSCMRWMAATGDQYCLDLVLEGCVYVPHASASSIEPDRSRIRQAGEEIDASSRGQRDFFARHALLAELPRRSYPRQNLKLEDAPNELPYPPNLNKPSEIHAYSGSTFNVQPKPSRS